MSAHIAAVSALMYSQDAAPGQFATHVGRRCRVSAHHDAGTAGVKSRELLASPSAILTRAPDAVPT